MAVSWKAPSRDGCGWEEQLNCSFIWQRLDGLAWCELSTVVIKRSVYMSISRSVRWDESSITPHLLDAVRRRSDYTQLDVAVSDLPGKSTSAGLLTAARLF